MSGNRVPHVRTSIRLSSYSCGNREPTRESPIHPPDGCLHPGRVAIGGASKRVNYYYYYYRYYYYYYYRYYYYYYYRYYFC